MPIRPIVSAAILTAAAAAAAQPNADLLDALQPKDATGVDRFLEQFPEADGRGIVIAIFDTGVDPGAPGMQTTPQGDPKVIDVVDASGSGDVDTSTTAELSEDGTITGLTGRTLTPDPAWANPTGEFRLGMKPAYEIYPRPLVSRIRAERKDDFDEQHRALVAAAKRDLADFDRETPEPDEDQLDQRKELEARIELLNDMHGSYSDPGPVFDCIVWHDGDTWRAAIDTDEDGSFDDETALTNFRDERQFATFGDDDLLNYALNIYNEGDVLSIVADAGSHGTHVAGIAAGYFPDQPELSGMAPGAQIVSVKIGDTRLGSSSVNTGTTRGMIAVLQNNADLINMSYGGPGAFPDTRYRMDRLAAELVNEHGVIWVASAGNSGPALSTVGGPGGTTSAIIGVGASITPAMMEAQYAVREGYAELQYPWSSRGPTLDGDMGVDITAPGGAISPIPTWTLTKNQLSNGTSMSSPSATGGIALMLSKLRQDDIAWHPASIKRAIQATALKIPEQSPWAQGAGMLQVDAAHEYMANYVDDTDRDVTFHARGPGNTRGIYLREPYQVAKPTEISVNFRPDWPEDADNRRKAEFEMRVRLEATEPWIETARFHNIASAGRSTTVRVDPTGLEPGAHHAEILAYDENNPNRGPMFTFPVTAIKPTELDEDHSFQTTVDTESGGLDKWFFHAPEGAAWVDVIAERLDDDTSRTLVLHLTQLRNDEAFSTRNSRSWLTFDDDDIQTRSMRVDGNRTVELALAQNWSSLGEGEFELTVRFRGLRPEPTHLAMHGATHTATLDIHSPLRDANASPSGSLTHIRRAVRPEDWDITPLDAERDMLWDGKQLYQLVLDYDLKMADDGEVTISPAVNLVPHAWEEFESFFWMLFDKNGKAVEIAAGANESVELDEGDYTLKFHVRHDDPSALESINATPVILDHKLGSAIGVSFARTPEAAMAGRGGFGNRELTAGSSARAYAAVPTKMPEAAETGDLLIGTFTLGAAGADLGGATSRPGGWPMSMVVAPKPIDRPVVEAKESDDDAETTDDVAENETDNNTDADADDSADDVSEPTRTEKLADEILELRIAALGDLMAEDDAEEFEALAAAILEQDPDSLDVPLARMDREAKLAEDGEIQPILDAAEDVIAAIDTNVLAAYRGIEHDEDADDFDKDLHERMTEEEDALLEALAQIVKTRTDAVTADDPATIEALEDSISRHEAWKDLDDELQHDADLAIARAESRHADALALIKTKLDDEPTKKLHQQRIELLTELGWDIWAAQENSRLKLEYPEFSRLF